MHFEWDEDKNTSNQNKHGVSFEEVKLLFLSDDDYLEVVDEAHSYQEDRFIAIGLIPRGVIMVVFTERADDVIRIISARLATKREQLMYYQYAGGLT